MILKTKDLKKYREKQLVLQNNIDPILNDTIINPVGDHDHWVGNIRQILDRETNQFLGKLEQSFVRFIRWKYPNADISQVLRNIADYLDEDYDENPLHPGFVSKRIKKFSRSTKKEQERILTINKIMPGLSKLENTKYYKSHLMRDENIYKI